MADEEFDETYFERLAAARSHWWTRGMQEISRTLLGELRGALAVLDDGCGSGGSLPLLRRAAGPRPVHAIDIAWPAVRSYRDLERRSFPLRASATRLPYRDGAFDLVVCTDVLQHLPAAGAAQALAEIARVLKPGGRALVRTNAAFARGGVEERDDWRLYRPESLRRELSDAGLAVVRLTHANALQALWASAPRLRARTGHDHGEHDHGEHDHAAALDTGHGLGIPRPVHPAKAAIGGALLGLEARWLRRPGRSIRFGHTLLAVAVKR